MTKMIVTIFIILICFKRYEATAAPTLTKIVKYLKYFPRSGLETDYYTISIESNSSLSSLTDLDAMDSVNNSDHRYAEEIYNDGSIVKRYLKGLELYKRYAPYLPATNGMITVDTVAQYYVSWIYSDVTPTYTCTPTDTTVKLNIKLFPCAASAKYFYDTLNNQIPSDKTVSHKIYVDNLGSLDGVRDFFPSGGKSLYDGITENC